MSSDYQLEDTIYLPFTTRAFATGIPTALVSGVVDIYEDVTATPIVTAETLAVSLNGHAGFNMITVTATDASGFGAGQSYTAILDAGTVDGVSVVGEVVAHFTLDKSAAAKDLANGTDGLGALKSDTAATLADTGTDGVVLAAGAVSAAALATDAVNEIARSIGIQKNTAMTGIEFLMIDSLDDISGKTGLTLTATRSIDKGAYAAITGTTGEVSGGSAGTYFIDPSADDLNGDIITFRFTSAGANDTFLTIATVA